MKKVILSIMAVILTFTLTACFKKGVNTGVFEQDNQTIVDETFNEIINAIKENDGAKIVDMFSNTVKSKVDLSNQAMRFVEYIQGDIISFSSAEESGIAADYATENGKTRKEITADLSINTSITTYYVAIKECVKDDFDDNNIGVTSLYIIDSNNWTQDYAYRGDGNWSQGINIAETFD